MLTALKSKDHKKQNVLRLNFLQDLLYFIGPAGGTNSDCFSQGRSNWIYCSASHHHCSGFEEKWILKTVPWWYRVGILSFVRWSMTVAATEPRSLRVFVYLNLCIWIFVFVVVQLHLCIHSCVFVRWSMTVAGVEPRPLRVECPD